MTLWGSLDSAPTVPSAAVATNSNNIMNSVRETTISRRVALAMIAAGLSPGALCSPRGQSTQKDPIRGSVPPAPEIPTTDTVRPKFHLTPASGWINDPQRPLWFNNTWNLWVLWNGDFPSGRGTAWRRFTSSDLVHWVDQGTAIPKYTTPYGDVWTGSAVVDANNTAGYGANAIVAIMTMSCQNLGGQSSGLWYSTDGGASFRFDTIVQKNPLAGDTTIKDRVFRDPCIFFHAEKSRWVMSLAEVGKISIYVSPDLKDWKYLSAMQHSDLGTLECPHLFPLHLYNPDGTTTEDRWILLCGANGSSLGFTTGTAYWVGNFDGSTFRPESSAPQWLDAGPDFYATTVFADANAADPLAHAFAIAWQNNWDYATAMPTKGYLGQLSITRQLRLEMVNGKPDLLNLPIAAQDSAFQAAKQGTDQIISDTHPYNWPAEMSNYSYAIDFTLSQVNSVWPSEVDLDVRCGVNDLTRVGFRPASNLIFLDRSKTGHPPKADSAWNTQRQVACDFRFPVTVRVFVDAGSVEVFVNGKWSLSGLITAPTDATGIRLTSSGGSAKISRLAIKH